MVQPINNSFSSAVLAWFDDHGRKDLPWQHNITPYRVWVSEIMLQQTQVATVIPYFLRFMEQLPDVQALANAEEDTVLHLWTGLGYYARARNLHKAAKTVCSEFSGVFPSDQAQLENLSGIGRSTAAAIRSIAFGQPATILDGNVKRVLARVHAVEGWPGKTGVANTLWQHAESHSPTLRCADYSQAMMDLGATLCTRSKPACGICPLQPRCEAHRLGTPQAYPGKKPPKTNPIKTTTMLMVQNTRGEVLLQKRPASGIWGGLWSFPEASDAQHVQTWLDQHIGNTPAEQRSWPQLRHTFSHYHLDITPVQINLAKEVSQIMEDDTLVWYKLRQPQTLGLAAPVKNLLAALGQQL